MPHSVVHARRCRDGVRYSAVFPQLEAGDYTVWRDSSSPDGTVTIRGGQVTDYQTDLTTMPRREHGVPARPGRGCVVT